MEKEGEWSEAVRKGEELTWPGTQGRVGFALVMQRRPRIRENPIRHTPPSTTASGPGRQPEEGACVHVCE